MSAVYLIALNPFVSATSGGDPYSVPLVNDTNPAANIVETTLTSEEATVEIGNGKTARAQTFNGQIPGPTFILNVGDTVVVHYQNNLTKESGIHWHGIELANGIDGTPFTQNQVAPGGNFLYKFTVTRPGLYWYHPHHHSSTNQVFKGLYGMIVVKDPNEAALQASGTLPSASQTKPIVLSDVTVCKAPGANDAETYNPALPHVSGGALPKQQPPTPKNLCEGPAVGANPYPIDENGSLRGPFAAGDIPNIQTAKHAGATHEGQTVLTNGKNVGGRAGTPAAPGALEAGASTLNVQPGQGLRLQLVNASAVRYFRLRLTTAAGALVPLVRVGGEGGLLNNAVEDGGTQGAWVTNYGTGEILLPPGTRADVVAAIPNAPTTGVLTLWTQDFERTGLGYSNLPTVPVMHLNLAGPTVVPAYAIAAGKPLRAATGDPVETLGAPTGLLLNPAVFTPPKEGLPNQDIKLTANAAVDLGVDGKFGTHDVEGDYMDAAHLGSSRYAKEGDVLQLEVKNQTAASHPFHLHGFSIQPVQLTNGGETFTWTYPEFRDNVDVPGGFTLKYKVKMDPRPLADGTTAGGALGRWVFHCHIFFHATNGMLSEVVVTNSAGNERPDVNVDNSELAVTQGGTATVTGTYKDRDGDPVTLSSSVGSVTDNGGGKYTWTYPTTSADSTQIVYVTATDSNGLKGQIPLYLKVNPAPAPNVKPVIKKLRVVPRKFAVAKGFTKLKLASTSKKAKKRRGTKIRFTLSEPARVKFTVKRLRPKRPKVKVRTFSRNMKKGGKKTVRFTGRFKGKKGTLPSGKYKLIAQATDSGGLKSKRRSTRFKILP
ncbi:MAG: multicopper oxidase domain-containing protein [Solirubrobacterales bacterium]